MRTSPVHVLVVGAGELGAAIATALCQQPRFHVSLLVRNRQKYAALEQQGSTLVEGDLTDYEQTVTTFRQYHTVLGASGFVGGAGTQRRLAEAAIEARVQRYIPWQWGVDYTAIGRGSAMKLFDEQLNVRQLLSDAAQQGQVGWLIVSTGVFTSFLFEQSFGLVDRRTRTVNALGGADVRMTFTAVEDIAKVTAYILADEALINTVVYTAGDTLSFEELRAVLSEVTGEQWSLTIATLPALKQAVQAEPTNPIACYRAVFGEQRGVAWDKQSTYNHKHQIDTKTVKQWLTLRMQSEPDALS